MKTLGLTLQTQFIWNVHDLPMHFVVLNRRNNIYEALLLKLLWFYLLLRYASLSTGIYSEVQNHQVPDYSTIDKKILHKKEQSDINLKF